MTSPDAPEQRLIAEYVRIRRETIEVLLRQIGDRWTPTEDVLKRIREVLWQAKRDADYEAAEAIYGDNRCEHDNWSGGGYSCPQCRQEAWQQNPWTPARIDGSP